MSKKSIYILIIFFSALSVVKPQGFNWEFSHSMPSDYPSFYLGVTTGGNYNYNIAELPFTENYVSCCEFNQGIGKGLFVGISMEKWYSGSYALGGNLNYSLDMNSFLKQNTYPRVNYNVTYELSFNSQYSYLGFELFWKKRLGLSHFNIKTSLKNVYLFSQTNDYSEKIISPEYEIYSDGTKERIIADGAISPTNNLIIIPKLAIGYDIDLNLGKFMNISMYSELPLMSIVKEGTWRRWNFGAEILVYYGIFL